MVLPDLYDSYPFIAPEKYKGKLNGKVVLVTGASAGIGIAIAKAFAAAGARVAAVARRESELNKVVDEIKAAGHHAIGVVGDVSKRGGPKEIVTQVEKQLGPIDVLVNNAGIARIGVLALEDEDVDIWWRVHEVNVRAPVAMIRAVLPGMIERGSGIVMTTSSNVATLPLPAMAAYNSSKAAISKFHEGISTELQGTGVFTFAIHPGMVESELGKSTDAINKSSFEHPAVKAFMAGIQSADLKHQKAELSADFMVALAADERCKALHGLHLNATQDLEPVLNEAEKQGRGRIDSEELYRVRINTL